MDIDSNLIDQVRRGKAVLLFGAGTLYGATFPEGKKPLLGNDLKEAICDRFLDGEYKDESLKFVAELATTASSLFDLQDFIANQFDGVEPAEFHKKISSFNWRALFSTNYDRLIEDAYRKASNPLQTCRAIISNDDPLDETSRTNSCVPLFKLHGCVSRTRDESLPLILTVDQYNDYKEKRDRLFNYLYELGFENTIVFVGHSLQDSNIRNVIDLLEKNVRSGRPKYYMIKPGVKRPEQELWASKRISVIDCTLEEFVNHLEERISNNDRALSIVKPPSHHPIQSKFIKNIELREDLSEFLTNQVDYVDSSISEDGRVTEFYAGASQGWFPICNNLDCSRTLTKTLIEDVISAGEAERKGDLEFHVIKGEAGAGKSVLLRRLAWKAANEYGRLCLFVKSMAQPKFEVIQEVYELSDERIFIFWDNAASNVTCLSRIAKAAGKRKIKLTVITGERYTEWNNKCEDLSQYITAEYKLRYLGRREIEQLIDLLEKHKCLGPLLTPLPREKRIQHCLEVFDRQLLVALHEATMGRPFEDIIYDEYQSLQPVEAKRLYRSICVLNRFRIPVRAGLIARTFGISFEQFSKRFFSPLEKVVITTGANNRDVHYTARHPEIAEIVFNRSFDSVQDRYHEYVSILKSLNISFESDRQSFRNMVKAKSLIELFPDFSDVDSIYKISLDAIGRDSYLLQQMANFERLRDNGNLRKAVSLLEEAAELSPKDNSILHTLAVVWNTVADSSADRIDRERYRQEARSILHSLIVSDGHTQHIDTVLARIEMNVLRDCLDDDLSSDKMIDDAIRNVEKIISESKKRFPSDESFLALESSFAQMVNDEERAVLALESAFGKDSRDPFIAIRLSNIYSLRGDVEKAKEILQAALRSKRGDQRLNFAMGELLRLLDHQDAGDLCYYYKRAFTPGDKNYQAQFWYARYAFESDDKEIRREASKIFSVLRVSKVSHELKVKIRDYVGGKDNPRRIRGKIVRRSGAYGFVQPDGFVNEAFVHEDSVNDDMWEVLTVGEDVAFLLGFNYTGLVCKDMEVM